MASVYKSMSNGRHADDSSEDGDDHVPKRTTQRVLILTSRGVTYRYNIYYLPYSNANTKPPSHRHLLNDLYALLPHSRKDAKLDTKSKLHHLNELADLYNTNNVLFFEARKGQDLYVWISKPPNGPTVKFHLHNLHTMSELHFPGNCLKGSRPVLSFDARFDTQPHLKLVRELLTHVFAVPKGARKTKPFVDHVMSFTYTDNKVWIRCYQIAETETSRKEQEESELPVNGRTTATVRSTSSKDTKLSLTEIGPRFVLTPIVILEGSFGGPVIYENKEFISPNQIRAELRLKRASKYARRSDAMSSGRVKKKELGLRSGEGRRRREGDELDDRVVFA